MKRSFSKRGLAATIFTTVLLCMTGCTNVPGVTQTPKATPKPLPSVDSIENVEYKKSPVITADTQVYNIMDYGATSDGKGDCSEALQNALGQVSGLGGGIIYFPEGIFKFNGSVILESECSGNIILSGCPTGNTILRSDQRKEETGAWITVKSPNIQLCHFTFQHNGVAGPMVNLSSENGILTDCNFAQQNTKNKNTAVMVTGSGNYVGNCYFGPGTTNEYVLSFTKVPGSECSDNIMADSYVGGALPGSVLVNSTDPGNCPKNIKILRNVFLFAVHGEVYVTAVDGLTIYNNMLDCTISSVVLAPDSNNIKNVDIRYNYLGAGSSEPGDERTTGGVITETSGGGSISGVTIADNYFWAKNGIWIDSENFTDFTIVNNYFVESKEYTFYIGKSVRNKIEGNIFLCNSAAILTVYIGDTDSETIFKNNHIHGRYELPQSLSSKDMNVFH